jgi:hypothetical protein
MELLMPGIYNLMITVALAAFFVGAVATELGLVADMGQHRQPVATNPLPDELMRVSVKTKIQRPPETAGADTRANERDRLRFFTLVNPAPGFKLVANESTPWSIKVEALAGAESILELPPSDFIQFSNQLPGFRFSALIGCDESTCQQKSPGDGEQPSLSEGIGSPVPSEPTVRVSVRGFVCRTNGVQCFSVKERVDVPVSSVPKSLTKVAP